MGSIALLPWSPAPEGVANDNEPATIGELIEAGRGLVATCEVCLHSGRLDLRDLAGRLGRGHSCSAAALRPRLQCAVCKSVDASLQVTRPRHGTARQRPGAARIPDTV